MDSSRLLLPQRPRRSSAPRPAPPRIPPLRTASHRPSPHPIAPLRTPRRSCPRPAPRRAAVHKRSAAARLASLLSAAMSYSVEPPALAASSRRLLAQSPRRTEGAEPRRASEKEQLRGLNERFAGYIERVRALEERNRALAGELAELRRLPPEPRRLGQLLGGELRALRARLEEAHGERAQAALERARLAEETQRLRARCEEEARGRAEAEQALRARQQAADGAARARADLERRAEALREELAELRRAHAEQLAQLGAALRAAAPPASGPPTARPDLAAALRELRAQYEALPARNLQAAEDWYRARCASLHERAARSQEAVRASRREAGECRRQLQARVVEMESLRGAHESLERQLQELEERHSAEAAGLQVSGSPPSRAALPSDPPHPRLVSRHRPAPALMPCARPTRLRCPRSAQCPHLCSLLPGIGLPSALSGRCPLPSPFLRTQHPREQERTFGRDRHGHPSTKPIAAVLLGDIAPSLSPKSAVAPHCCG